ncbi:MAG: hypothetical protein U0183_15540 [Polyangiaceae bacterium]
MAAKKKAAKKKTAGSSVLEAAVSDLQKAMGAALLRRPLSA